jgi:predicted Rossmann fold flavoprotein
VKGVGDTLTLLLVSEDRNPLQEEINRDQNQPSRAKDECRGTGRATVDRRSSTARHVTLSKAVTDRSDIDIVVIGAGAAGLATAIFAGRTRPGCRVVVFDGARTPGAKILVSGGSRCNVTNSRVTERDFNGGRPGIIRKILREFPASATVDFFRDLGVGLHEEPLGKLFPDSNRSRDVLEALLRGVASAGAQVRPSHRVHLVTRESDGLFTVTTSQGPVRCRRVVVATGGLSLPKTGSDGLGYDIARRFGHSIVPTTPALVPLCFDRDAGSWNAGLSGVSLPSHLRVVSAGQPAVNVAGSMLWTHFGISGPAALDVSRHWLRHRLEGRSAEVRANILGDSFEAAERRWIATAATRPRQTVVNAVAALVPGAVADAVVAYTGVNGAGILADLPRQARRALLHTLTDWPLPVVDSRGYSYAEVTAGGVSLPEINPATMESRITPGLYFVGEVLDVDGRLGGFNFQWAWSTAHVAGRAVTA